MSIEEEPNTINDNKKTENVENQIKSKINLKQLNHLKPNILSPPDTPQINDIKKGEIINLLIDGEMKTTKENDITEEINIDNYNQINSNKTENNCMKKELNKNNNDIIEIDNGNGKLIKDKEETNIDKNKKTEIESNINIIEEANKTYETKNMNIDNTNENKNMNIDNNNSSNLQENSTNNKIIEINNKDNNDVQNNKTENVKKDLESSSSNNEKMTKLEGNKVIVKVDILNKQNLIKNNENNHHKMSRSEANVCTNITRSLQLHPRAFAFLKPVDPVALNIPDYFTVIKQPMDLSTIMKKIKTNKYNDINDYINDVELMFNNCFKYNPPANPVHIAGLKLRDYFIEQLRRLSPEVQASLEILKKEDNEDNSLVNGKRPKRQIKAVQHLEPEFHITKKMKVIHKNSSNDLKPENQITEETNKVNDPLSTDDSKKDIIILTKSNSLEKTNNTIKSVSNNDELEIKKNNGNKTTIKKLITTSRSTKLIEQTKNKNEEEEEEDEIEEEEDDDEIEMDEEEEEDDDDDDDDLNIKTKSVIRASQKVISRMHSKNLNNNNKIRNISAQSGSINKKPAKSKLIKSISKVPSLPMDQLYQANPSENLIEMQINTLTMCLQKVTKQLELLQVQSKARKLKRKAKRLAKSLNMEDYDYQSDSDSIEDLSTQASLLSSETSRLMKRKSKTKVLNKKSKIQSRRLKDDDDNDDEFEEEVEEEYDEYEENKPIAVNKRKGKTTGKEKPIKKEVNRPRQKNVKTETKGRKRGPKGNHENSYDIKKVCEYCGDTDTPMWRRGPNGKGTLCNKCGVKWKGGKIYQGEEIPTKRNKNMTNDNEAVNTPETPQKKERKRRAKTTKNKEKKKESTKNNKTKQQKVTEITYNQKKELSEMINYLSEEKISGVVDIIKSSIPDIKDTQEEIELDIETINPATLYKLYNYVKKVSKPKNNKKNQEKNDDTSSGESSAESSESEDDSSDSDSEPNQFMSRR